MNIVKCNDIEILSSKILKRNVKIEIIRSSDRVIKHICFFNDGQDFDALQMKKHVSRLGRHINDFSVLVIGIHAQNRIQEYGTASKSDYKKRGALAHLHQKFVIHELLPFIIKFFDLGDQDYQLGYIGFSLGGLTAFDVAFNHPSIFNYAGVFSGSFWWRHKAFTPDTPDDFRIMEEIINESIFKPSQRFWFQTGTLDELSDRNNNGVIDSIDDTKAIINALIKKGYTFNQNIKYHEVEGGTHSVHTWSSCMDQFFNYIFNL